MRSISPLPIYLGLLFIVFLYGLVIKVFLIEAQLLFKLDYWPVLL